MSEKLKVELTDEEGNIYYLHTDASIVYCSDGTTVEDKLNSKINTNAIIQNATTNATDKIPSAAVAKNLQDQITEVKDNIGNIWKGEVAVDITDTSTYDQNKWYPVVGTEIPHTARIRVYNALYGSSKPSWSTHTNGFSVYFEIETEAYGWGATNEDTILIHDQFTFCDVSPVSFQQIGWISVPVLFLRGGGKYQVQTNYTCTWTPYPNGYTYTYGNNTDTISPATSRPSTNSGIKRNFAELIQNTTTSDTTKIPSAAVTKSLQDQVNTKQPNLGFTPVRQGTGIGQNGSIIHIGYSPSNGRLKATVDSTDFGNIVFDSQLNNYCYKTSAYRILSIQEVVISAGNLTPNSQTTGHAWFPAVSGAVAYYPFLKNQGWCSTTGASISGTTLEVSFVNTGPNAHTASAIYYVVAIGAV